MAEAELYKLRWLRPTAMKHYCHGAWQRSDVAFVVCLLVGLGTSLSE